MSDDEYIGADEAAKILRLSSRMVYRYGEDNKLRTIRAGRRILFHHADVLALAKPYDISNRQRLGATEADLINRLYRGIQRLNDIHGALPKDGSG